MKLGKKVLIISVTACLMFSNVISAKNRHEQALENNTVIRAVMKQGLPTSHLSVNARGHLLQVIGFVDDAKQMRALMQILKKYKDHDRVINNVKILSPKNSQDEKQLIDSAYQALNDAKLPTNDINLQVRNGHIIAGGFINRHIKVNEIGKVLRSVPGAHTVNNYVLYKS